MTRSNSTKDGSRILCPAPPSVRLQFCDWTEIIVIVDDYGDESWTYCQKAADDYRGQARAYPPLP